MGSCVEIGALKTWYDEQGGGEPLVLREFSTRFRVIVPERRGHGHVPDVEGPLSYQVMSAKSIGFWMRSLVARRIWWDGVTAASSGCSSRWPVPTWCASSS